MRDAEGRKKEVSMVIQTTRQSNTAHPRQSLFQRKMSCLGWDLNPRHVQVQTSPDMYRHSNTSKERDTKDEDSFRAVYIYYLPASLMAFSRSVRSIWVTALSATCCVDDGDVTLDGASTNETAPPPPSALVELPAGDGDDIISITNF